MITISQLKAVLTGIEAQGYGSAEVWIADPKPGEEIGEHVANCHILYRLAVAPTEPGRPFILIRERPAMLFDAQRTGVEVDPKGEA